MFSLEELVVYPAQGVGHIAAIEHKEVGGASLDFYIVRILGSNVTLMVPVKNARSVGLRKLCSKEEAARMLDSLRDHNGFTGYTGQNWNRRQREYTEKLKSGQLEDVCHVLKDITIIGRDKELSFGERRLLEQATGLLCSELSLVLGREFDEVKSEVESFFATAAADAEPDAEKTVEKARTVSADAVVEEIKLEK